MQRWQFCVFDMILVPAHAFQCHLTAMRVRYFTVLCARAALATVLPAAYADTDVRFWLTGGAKKRRSMTDSAAGDASTLAAGAWSCSACTFYNSSGSRCEICNTKRTVPEPGGPADEGGTESGIGDASSDGHAAEQSFHRKNGPSSEQEQAKRTLQFCVSAKTGRIFLCVIRCSSVASFQCTTQCVAPLGHMARTASLRARILEKIVVC